MRKKISLGAAISIMFIAMTLTFCVTMLLSTRLFEQKVESVNAKEAMYDKIGDIDSVVRQYFYTDISDSAVLEAISAGYIEGLGDSESKYFTVDEVNEYKQVQDGKIIGIGVDFVKSRENAGYMLIYNVYNDSPADVEGIVSGDLIVSINGTSTINMSYDTALEMLRGVSGDTVDVVFIHEGTEAAVTLTHRAYDTPSVTQGVQDDYGYVKISSFSRKTASELDYALRNLVSQNIKSLVIDVRDNSSLDFDSAAECADLILSEGTTMYAVYNDGERKVLYTSDKNSVDVPVVVVTNSNTAYAAEMFTMMMKDSQGAKTVGTTTKGKATLQKLYRLPDGSGIELTVASLSPVTSASYNGSGISPDYEKTAETARDQSIYLLSMDEDPQVQRAFEVAAYLAGVSRTADEKQETVTDVAADGESTDEEAEGEDTEDKGETSEEPEDNE